MKKKEIPKKYIGKWVLLDKKKKVIYFSSSVSDVMEKGRKYPIDDVTIEKKLERGTCFF
ncbi:unnamed protein product [marine sediment metagenome]|uniref:Uncharacterized protein n=1 Tax=marine sediment metagenome TaxID=412755 RepID=X1MFD9_9ZZZZ